MSSCFCLRGSLQLSGSNILLHFPPSLSAPPPNRQHLAIFVSLSRHFVTSSLRHLGPPPSPNHSPITKITKMNSTDGPKSLGQLLDAPMTNVVYTPMAKKIGRPRKIQNDVPVPKPLVEDYPEITIKNLLASSPSVPGDAVICGGLLPFPQRNRSRPRNLKKRQIPAKVLPAFKKLKLDPEETESECEADFKLGTLVRWEGSPSPKKGPKPVINVLPKSKEDEIAHYLLCQEIMENEEPDNNNEVNNEVVNNEPMPTLMLVEHQHQFQSPKKVFPVNKTDEIVRKMKEEYQSPVKKIVEIEGENCFLLSPVEGETTNENVQSYYFFPAIILNNCN